MRWLSRVRWTYHSLQCLLNLLSRIAPLLRLATAAFFGGHLPEESGQSLLIAIWSIPHFQ